MQDPWDMKWKLTIRIRELFRQFPSVQTGGKGDVCKMSRMSNALECERESEYPTVGLYLSQMQERDRLIKKKEKRKAARLKIIKRRIKNAAIKTIGAMNVFIFITSMAAMDSDSILPFIGMGVSGVFIFLIAAANGWIMKIKL